MLLFLNKDEQTITEENILKVVDFIKRSMVRHKFPIEIAAENGLMKNVQLAKLYIDRVRAIDTDGYMFIYLNHDCKTMYDMEWASSLGKLVQEVRSVFVPIDIRIDDDLENIRSLLEESSLSEKIHLNIIIDKEDFDITRIFNMMPKYSIHNYLTLWIDHSKGLDYNTIAKNIVNLIPARKKRSIALEFGCGYRSCMFSDAEIGSLFRSPMVDMSFYCRPRAVINPDLSINYCLDKNSYKLNLNNMKNIQDMFEQFELVYEDFGGAIKDCEYCWSKDKMCKGGCPIY